jgi:hypothetical protein
MFIPDKLPFHKTNHSAMNQPNATHNMNGKPNATPLKTSAILWII